MVPKAHPNAIIEIRRDVTGAKRRRRWRSLEEATSCIGLITDYWESQVTELHLKPEVKQQLSNITERGMEWRRTLQRLRAENKCEKKLKNTTQNTRAVTTRNADDYESHSGDHGKDAGNGKVEVRTGVGTKRQSGTQTLRWTRSLSRTYT